jgi:hypothetical protein
LNTFGERNSNEIQRTRRGINGGALGVFSTKNPPTFLVESSNLQKGCERWKKGGERVLTVWMGMNASEMIEEREDGE